MLQAARRDWAADTLGAIPAAWRGRVARLHGERMEAARAMPAGTGAASDAEREANLWLAGTAERMRAIRVPLNLSDTELCELARRCAAECVDIAFSVTVTDTAAIRRKMAAFVVGYGIEPPLQKISDETGEITGVSDMGAIRRMGCGVWWRRRLRVAQGRAIEREAIRLGYVHKNREMYASTLSVERRQQQKRRNAKALADTVAVNQYGDEFTLAELAARAVSNPVIRRGELMTRIAGFESISRGLEHVAMFFTVTCPSRMHPKKQAGGNVFDNPKYDGTTPKEAARYLSGMWAKCRAALARAGAAVYGFRIAEPHHDATPHWHLLLFMAGEFKATVCSIFAKYARQENAEEMTSKEARNARFLAKEIEYENGWTAAGYIAKYVSKNIDGGGYQVQGDLEGGAYDAFTPSHRVETWASTWGVRQFQQIGGAPVGVWRELRRIKDAEVLTDTVRRAYGAADVGNWHAYNEAQGGVLAKRKDRPVAVAYTREGERYDADKGECYEAPATKYGEKAAKAVYGVRDCVKGRAFVTRVFRWEVKTGGRACTSVISGSSESVRGGGLTRGVVGVGCASGVQSSAVVFGFDFAGLARPWTRVNNCTEGVGNGEGKLAGSSLQGAEPGTKRGGGNVHAGGCSGGDQRNGRNPRGSGGGSSRFARTGSASEGGA